MNWNSTFYDQKHDFVSKYGEGVIEMLDPKEGETILDLGCGTGDLAGVIQSKGANVTGLDSSKEMIQAAKQKYPHIDFELKSADNFSFENPFDAVFSNATLHWILEKEKALRCIYNCLKPGGRFVAEFGGKGNVAHIINALKQSLISKGYKEAANKKVWYFPSLSEYTTLLEQTGLRVTLAAHFDRETLLKDDEGMSNWLQMFGKPYFQNLDNDVVATIVKDVEKRLKPTNFKNGHWYADYVRLRIVAIKN